MWTRGKPYGFTIGRVGPVMTASYGNGPIGKKFLGRTLGMVGDGRAALDLAGVLDVFGGSLRTSLWSMDRRMRAFIGLTKC